MQAIPERTDTSSVMGPTNTQEELSISISSQMQTLPYLSYHICLTGTFPRHHCTLSACGHQWMAHMLRFRFPVGERTPWPDGQRCSNRGGIREGRWFWPYSVFDAFDSSVERFTLQSWYRKRRSDTDALDKQQAIHLDQSAPAMLFVPVLPSFPFDMSVGRQNLWLLPAIFCARVRVFLSHLLCGVYLKAVSNRKQSHVNCFPKYSHTVRRFLSGRSIPTFRLGRPLAGNDFAAWMHSIAAFCTQFAEKLCNSNASMTICCSGRTLWPVKSTRGQLLQFY